MGSNLCGYWSRIWAFRKNPTVGKRAQRYQIQLRPRGKSNWNSIKSFFVCSIGDNSYCSNRDLCSSFPKIERTNHLSLYSPLSLKFQFIASTLCPAKYFNFFKIDTRDELEEFRRPISVFHGCCD